MEKKKKELKLKKENETKKQSIIFFTIIAIFVMLILVGVIAGKNLKSTFGATAYYIEFRGATDYNLHDHGYNVPEDGKCQTDQYGYLDPDCAYKIACVCGSWSRNRSYIYNGSDCGVVPIDNPGELESNALFTYQFNENKTFYCSACSSSAGCPSEPVTSCYVCEGGSGPVRTINETRAATMTGVDDSGKCQKVSDSQCETPSTSTDKCYSCILGTGKEYVYSKSKEEAVTKTGGTNCQAVADTYCNNRQENCYSCDTEDGKKYVSTTSVENAQNGIVGGTNCTIVKKSYCEIVPNNPKTGIIGIVIAWLIGLSALTYSVIYFIKIKK